LLETRSVERRTRNAVINIKAIVFVAVVKCVALKDLFLRRDLSRYVFVKECAIRIDKKQKERYGKKYCHHSPSIEESLLQDAVMRAIMQTAKQNVEVLKTLKIHIGMGLTDEVTEDKTLDIQIRIAEINTEFQKLLKAVSADNADGIDEERITELMNEKQRLTVQLEQYAAMRQKRESAKSRLDEIYTILDGLQNHPMEYNDKLVRQIIECIVVESKEKIKVVFIGGTEIEMTL
jgi:site-specific DNA recombinase